MMKTKILLILCIISASVQAQFVTNNKRVADVYFQNKEYFAASEYYKKALGLVKDSSGAFVVVPYGFANKITEDDPKETVEKEYLNFHLAESLRLFKNYEEAVKIYAVAKDYKNPKYVLSTLWYGESLRAMQRYQEAIDQFNIFLDKYKVQDIYTKLAKEELASCQFALQELRYPRMYSAVRVNNEINNTGSNYTPYLKGGLLYFTSSRKINVGNKKEVLMSDNGKVTRNQTPFLNTVYVTDGNPISNDVKVSKTAVIGNDRESAAPAFHPSGKYAYVTSWTTSGNKKLYQLNATPGASKEWSEPIELGSQINVKGFNSMQPFVTKDGQFLIFSSDRPGGSGKYDLWYAAIRVDGSLGTAVNMGNVINSPEDDQAPYYNGVTKRLLFSTNGRVGMGGFDFFESDGDFGTWSEPRNMGYPFNSAKDDLYYTPLNDDGSDALISSDRDSPCCLELLHLKTRHLTIKGRLLDCNTFEPLKDATVILADSVQEFRVKTDADGKYSFKVNSNRYFKLTAEKDKYFSKTLTFNYGQMAERDTLFSPELCLTPFEMDKPIVLKDVLYEFNKAELTPDSKEKLDHLYDIMIDNPTIEIELSSHTDSKGTDAYNFDLSDRRARSCVEYLIGKGIGSNRMTSKGYGESKPIAPNELPDGKDNPDGRALNRRTEFKVTKK